MSRTITVVTPENITLTYQAAGIASRFMAVVVDLLIQIGTAILVMLGIQTAVGGGAHSGVGLASLVSTAGIVFVGIILPFAYAIFFEMLWGGRTPGKRLFGLRAVRDGGYPITLLSSVIRNILRIIDFGIVPLATPIVLCGLPGLVCMFLSPTYKRIGDYAAGTVVVVEGSGVTMDRTQTPRAEGDGVAAFLPLVRNLDRLTPAEYELIRRFTGRRHGMDIVAQAGLAERLARPLLAKLDMDMAVYYQLQYADVLQAIERRYAEERGIL